LGELNPEQPGLYEKRPIEAGRSSID